MKTILGVVCALLAGVGVCRAALILQDPFNYSSGSNLGGQGGWINGYSGDEVNVVSGNLSVSGLVPSTGNMIGYGGEGMDPYRTFASQSATTYYSVAFEVTSLGSLNTSGGFVLSLASGTSYAASLWLKSDGSGGFIIGISKKSDSTVVWSSSSYSVNSTIFVVGCYVFNSGTDDDLANLWINPNSSSFSAGTEPSATLSTTTSGNDSGNLTRFYFRQDDSTHTPGTIIFDELRVGSSWADVTPVPELPQWGLLSSIGLLAFCGLREWRQHGAGLRH
jgi:hypothetical protein